VRELAEETGLTIRLTSIFDVYHGNDDPRTNAILILYLGEVIGGEMKADDDALDVRYFPLNDLPEKIAFIAHNQALRDYINRFNC
jgi:8-oxo-dGTP diphosphatase